MRNWRKDTHQYTTRQSIVSHVKTLVYVRTWKSDSMVDLYNCYNHVTGYVLLYLYLCMCMQQHWFAVRKETMELGYLTALNRMLVVVLLLQIPGSFNACVCTTSSK
jgi:hypothetical protein